MNRATSVRKALYSQKALCDRMKLYCLPKSDLKSILESGISFLSNTMMMPKRNKNFLISLWNFNIDHFVLLIPLVHPL